MSDDTEAIRAQIHAEREVYPRTWTKVSYNVMLKHGPGATETFKNDDGTTEVYDLAGYGAQPFSAGFPTLESTAATAKRAQEWADEHAPGGQVWIEKITETTLIERVS